jgi:hypothetical protein
LEWRGCGVLSGLCKPAVWTCGKPGLLGDIRLCATEAVRTTESAALSLQSAMNRRAYPDDLLYSIDSHMLYHYWSL